MDNFRFEGKPSCASAKSTPFPVSRDEWDTKGDTGKSMKNALYVLTSRAEATSNSEKIKPVALAVIELRLSESISQLKKSQLQSIACAFEHCVWQKWFRVVHRYN